MPDSEHGNRAPGNKQDPANEHANPDAKLPTLVTLTLTELQFTALFNCAGLGAAIGITTHLEQELPAKVKEVAVYGATQAIVKLGQDGWNELTDRAIRLSQSAWPHSAAGQVHMDGSEGGFSIHRGKI